MEFTRLELLIAYTHTSVELVSVSSPSRIFKAHFKLQKQLNRFYMGPAVSRRSDTCSTPPVHIFAKIYDVDLPSSLVSPAIFSWVLSLCIISSIEDLVSALVSSSSLLFRS
ncbi:hypothetical protein XPA_008455 [Xanthoria parietina]